MQEIIFWLARLLDVYPVPVFALLTALAMFVSKKRFVLLSAVAATALLVPVVKEVYAEQRPCAAQEALALCDGYGFPSGHAAIAAVLAVGVLGSPWMFFFLPAAYFIGYTRILLNVHSFGQVVGGLAFGLMVFFVADALARAARGAGAHKKKPEFKQEMRRQLFHMYVGVAVVVAAIKLGASAVEEALFVAIFAGLLLINAKMLGAHLSLFEAFLRDFERRSAEFPGKGALFFAVGALFLFTFSLSSEFALAALSILAVSDGASTMVGMKHGKDKLPWNKEKSWHGTIAFFLTGSVVAWLFIGWQGVFLAAFLALVETYDFHIDDNLLIPIASVAFNLFTAMLLVA